MSMQLRRYFSALTPEQKTLFAKKAKTSAMYLTHIIQGRRRPGIEKCVDIEKASGGKVRCEALNPDLPWRYLANRGR
jgi:DNA-binding transcriptional regulator YdaS (Cro superfamily)